MTTGSVRSHYHLLPRRWQDLKEIYHPVCLHHSGKHAENQLEAMFCPAWCILDSFNPKEKEKSLTPGKLGASCHRMEADRATEMASGNRGVAGRLRPSLPNMDCWRSKLVLTWRCWQGMLKGKRCALGLIYHWPSWMSWGMDCEGQARQSDSHGCPSSIGGSKQVGLLRVPTLGI